MAEQYIGGMQPTAHSSAVMPKEKAVQFVDCPATTPISRNVMLMMAALWHWIFFMAFAQIPFSATAMQHMRVTQYF